MLGGGAEVSMGFLEQLQPVFHRHLHNDGTQRRGEERRQSAVGLNSGKTELYSGWRRRHGWNDFNLCVLKLEVEVV